jgi:hypothetical protein
MAENDFAFCVFDPEGDYDELENAVSIGDAETTPTEDEALKLLRLGTTNLVINTQSLSVEERPVFFANLLPQLSLLRARSGRPHWLVIDEAHHPTTRLKFCHMPAPPLSLLPYIPKLCHLPR